MPPPNGIHVVGAGLAVDPALGPEGERVGVEVLAVVEEQDAHRAPACPAGTAYSPSRHGTVTRRPIIGITGRERIASVDDRARPSSASSPRADGLAQPVVGVGDAHEPLPGPGERVGGRLVAGEHEREQLVAQLLVGQRLAVLGRRLEQQREDVAALAEVGGGAALGDHRVGRPVEERQRELGRPDRLVAADVQQLAELGDRFQVERLTSVRTARAQPVLGRARARACPRCRRSRP